MLSARAARCLLAALVAAAGGGASCTRTRPSERTPAPKGTAAPVSAAAGGRAGEGPGAASLEGQGGAVDGVEGLVAAAAGRYGVDESLLLAIIWNESRFDPQAVSSAGARGLMQLMPSTTEFLAGRLGVEDPDPHDPAFAVEAGSNYLRWLLDRFGGDERTALAAYAAGHGAIERRLRAKRALPGGARRYAERVLKVRDAFARGDPPSRREGVPDGIRLPPALDGDTIERLIETDGSPPEGPSGK